MSNRDNADMLRENFQLRIENTKLRNALTVIRDATDKQFPYARRIAAEALNPCRTGEILRREK